MPRKMPEKPDRLRVAAPALLQAAGPARPDARPGAGGHKIGVDREARMLCGYVVALAGPFKSEGRGEFDQLSLDQIVQAWPAAGLKSRFSHPTESADGLGRHLGRALNPHLSTATVERGGKQIEVPCVRADLALADVAFESPPDGGGLPYGEYVLRLAESDPGALSTSLVLSKQSEYRRKADGTPELDAEGHELPPLWRIKQLHASDVVDEGDAVDSILAPAGKAVQSLRYTRDYLSVGTSLIDKLFAGQSRRVVRARLTAFLHRYLDRRYGTVGNNDYLGATLGALLDDYIEQQTSDERPREIIVGQMAEASGLTVEQVSAIIQGGDEGVTASVLEAFAKVLQCPLGELVSAAEADGIDFAGEPPAPDQPAADPAATPAPDQPAPMSARTGTLRRRLALKEKAGA